MKVKMRKYIITTGIFAFLVLTSCLISIKKFGVVNPIATGVGVIKILATDAESAEIQKSPRVVLAKPDKGWDLFLETMKMDGYSYLEEERLGSACVFEKDGAKEIVFFKVNSYYSKWTWEK